MFMVRSRRISRRAGQIKRIVVIKRCNRTFKDVIIEYYGALEIVGVIIIVVIII